MHMAKMLTAKDIHLHVAAVLLQVHELKDTTSHTNYSTNIKNQLLIHHTATNLLQLPCLYANISLFDASCVTSASCVEIHLVLPLLHTWTHCEHKHAVDSKPPLNCQILPVYVYQVHSSLISTALHFQVPAAVILRTCPDMSKHNLPSDQGQHHCD